ncbi:MAG: glycosyltransferase family 2 protein, partial [Candidatus Tantalella remota]|nr:glycosyltransferase family 2 protein [Candidatus Tantalella remota]
MGSFISGFFNYIQFSVDDVMARSPLAVFFLFAPALAFDTMRYYITNTAIFFLDLFRRETAENEPVTYLPKVSAIVPVRNEGERLKLTIDSILESNYPKLEVIIVDDCSEDRTQELCRPYEEKGLIKYIRTTVRSGKPAAVNYGFKFATGEIVIHFDGDVAIDRDAIREAIKPFEDLKVGAVSGNLKVRNDRESLVTRLQAAEYGMGISVGRRWAALTDTLQIASGAFSCFRKEVLADVKGADPEYGEDLDLTLKTRKLGFKVAFAPKAVAMTDVPNTWFGLFKQRVRWDRCYVRINLRKHKNMFDFRVFRWGDFFAGIQDIIFNLILVLLFPVYILFILLFVPQLFLFIIVITYLFYTVMNFGQFVIVALLSERPARDAIFVLYTPLFFPYSLFLR